MLTRLRTLVSNAFVAHLMTSLDQSPKLNSAQLEAWPEATMQRTINRFTPWWLTKCIVRIRKATEFDLEAMWRIHQSVVTTGDTLPFASSLDLDTFHDHWFGPHTSFVAAMNSDVLAMYKVGANYPDLGSHIASATYVVSPPYQGRGIGRALVTHSIAYARRDGFLGLQFNYVVSTNAAAVELYKRLGLSIVGTLPQAFRHQQLGLVDVYVMHRHL